MIFSALLLSVLGISGSAWAQPPQICGQDAADAPAAAMKLLITQVAERCKSDDTSCDVTDFSDSIGSHSVNEVPALLGKKVYSITAKSTSSDGGRMWVQGTVECGLKSKEFKVTAMQAGHGGNTFDLDSNNKADGIEKSDDCPSDTPYLFPSVAYVSGNKGPACCSEATLRSHCVIPPLQDCSEMGAGKWDLVNGQCVPHAEPLHKLKMQNPCQILNPTRAELQQCLDQNKDEDSDENGTAGSGA